MIIKFLTFLLIVLAIGSGVGYWLLVTAEDQSRKLLNVVGTFFGWLLITLSILITLFGFYFKLNSKSIIGDEYAMYHHHHHYGYHQHHHGWHPYIGKDEGHNKGNAKDEQEGEDTDK